MDICHGTMNMYHGNHGTMDMYHGNHGILDMHHDITVIICMVKVQNTMVITCAFFKPGVRCNRINRT